MRDKHLCPMLQWIVRCLYLLLRHIAQTRPGVVDPKMLTDGQYFYQILKDTDYCDRELEIK